MSTKEAVKDADAGTDSQGFPVNTDASSTAEVTNTETAAKGGARPRPVYAAEKVTELPVDLTLPKSGPRTNPQFIEALQVAQADAGEWYCVATFESANGAKSALKRIQAQKVTIPAGDWDFEARRIEAPGSTEETPLRWSKLYAKSLG